MLCMTILTPFLNNTLQLKCLWQHCVASPIEFINSMLYLSGPLRTLAADRGLDTASTLRSHVKTDIITYKVSRHLTEDKIIQDGHHSLVFIRTWQWTMPIDSQTTETYVSYEISTALTEHQIKSYIYLPFSVADQNGQGQYTRRPQWPIYRPISGFK